MNRFPRHSPTRILAALVALTLLATLPTRTFAQTETPQERAERLREAAEKTADQQRAAQERAEQQREANDRAAEQRQAAEERANRQREANDRAAEQRAEQQQRANQQQEQQRQRQQQEPQQRPQQQQQQQQQQSRPATATPGYTPPANAQRPAQPAPGTTYRPGATQTQAPPPTQPKTPATVYRPGGATTPNTGATTTPRPSGQATTPGVTVYTPHPTTPGSAPANSAAPVRTTPSGATVYTPRAASATPAAQPAAITPARAYTPAAAVRISRPPAYTAAALASIASRTRTGASVLTPAGSQSTVRQINTSRTAMKGVNSRPIPQGVVTVHPNGNLTVATTAGNRYDLRPTGTVAALISQGRSVNFRPNGRVSAIHADGINIQRGLYGEQTIRSARPDGSILVSTGASRGYLQRTMVVNNRTIIQRTYVSPALRGGRGAVVATRAYVGYSMRGVVVPLYIAPVYYSPAFYGWAYYPWATPFAYSWGWGNDPWFGFYTGYYRPFGVYARAAAWLTDYYLSQTLANAYAMQNQAPPLPGYDDSAPADPDQPADDLVAQDDTPITPDLENAISDEVQRQLSYENAIASGTAQQTVEELPNSLKPDRIFVVFDPLSVATPDGQTCELGAGDVLHLNTPPADDAPAATLQVASGKRQDCPAGTQVTISLADLAEMQNNLRVQMDAGLNVLRSGQGQGGIPAAPPSAMAGDPRNSMPDVPLPPDPNVAGLLTAQQQDAQATELATVQSVVNTNQ